MERQLDTELIAIKGKIVAMGGYVERAVEEATLALSRREKHRLQQVRIYEDQVNKAHKEVDEACLSLLARLSPIATDLRLILAIIKINTDLERMGDQALNISYNTEHLLDIEHTFPLTDISKMEDLVRLMIKDCLDAFVKRDRILAQSVLARDDEVDDLKDKVMADMVRHITLNPADAEGAIDLILVARNLERLGDHATNIAEDVIFIATGQDVRHGGVQKT
jgi:phosphate transport system protein